MGIKDLNKFIKTFSPKAINQVPISNYAGKTLAVDTSIFLYKFKYSYKLIDSFFQQYCHFKKEGVELIYVFDGKPPEEKEYVLNTRKNAREKQVNKIEEIKKKIDQTDDNNFDEKKKLKKQLAEMERRYINITQEDIDNVKSLFDRIGAKYIHHESEADPICCDMFKKGIVQGCISNDMDFLPTGAGILIRNYNLGNMVDEYNLDVILEETGMDLNKFIDFCILCGCDYTCKIPRLGFITAFKSLQQFDNIETIIEELCIKQEKFKLPQHFNYKIARKLLKDGGNKFENYEIHNITFNKSDTQEIVKFISENTKYSDLQIINRLKIIFNNIK